MGSYAPVRPTKYCHACAAVIDAMAVVCPQCAVPQPVPEGLRHTEKRILPALLLCLLLGPFGVHRFYVGKVGTGLLQLVTLGGLGVWAVIDFVLIVVGSFRDKSGNRITEWT